MGKFAVAGIGLVGVMTAVTIACGSEPDEEIAGPSGPDWSFRGTPTETVEGGTGSDSGSGMTGPDGGTGNTGDSGINTGTNDSGTGSTGDSGSSTGSSSGNADGTSGTGGPAAVSTITNPPVTVPGSSGSAITPGSADDNGSSCSAVPGRTQSSGTSAFLALALGTALFARRRKK